VGTTSDAQARQSDAITREYSACFNSADKKYRLQADGPIASAAIWHAELKRCQDVMSSRFIAQFLKEHGGNCSLKLDWMLRYQMMGFNPDQKAMAQDRYAEICGGKVN
jgi:hypothetical protein